MTKRGEPLPINQALNRPRAKLGLDLSAWMAIVSRTSQIDRPAARVQFRPERYALNSVLPSAGALDYIPQADLSEIIPV